MCIHIHRLHAVQNIVDKHSAVTELATQVQGKLNCIKDRKDGIHKQNDRSQPAIFQALMTIIEVTYSGSVFARVWTFRNLYN